MYIWDENKSRLNKKKHGISFEEAKASIFEGKYILAPDLAYDKGEARRAIIGKHRGKYYVGIFTVTLEGIRIISVRRARNEEQEQVEKQGL